MAITTEQIEALQNAAESIKEAIEGAKETAESINAIKELVNRIKDARDNPESLDPDAYAELARDLMMVIPDKLPLPAAAKKAIGLLATAISSMVSLAVTSSLSVVAHKFHDELRAGESPKDAAERATHDGSARAWLLTKYRLGEITREKRWPGFPTINDKIDGFFRRYLPERLFNKLKGKSEGSLPIGMGGPPVMWGALEAWALMATTAGGVLAFFMAAYCTVFAVL